MNKKLAFAVAAFAVAVLSGCSAGMQPEGPDAAQVKAKEAALPPAEQIAMIRNSPMPAAQKEQKIADILAKNPGLKESAPANPRTP